MSAQDNHVGQRPRFQRIRTLGEGAEGRVLLASDSERADVVAIKRVRNPSSRSLLRLKAEFRAVSELRHPGLVRLYELGQDDEGLYFTMEPIEGVTLDRYLGLELRDCSITETPDVASLSRLARVLPQIVEALDTLHTHGFVHRDLKPNNIMVGHDGQVKLLDFGILAALGERGDGLGTVAFMAPEQVNKQATTPASDLYALGVMLFWCLTGTLPFVGTAEGVLCSHLEEQPPEQLIPDSAPRPLVDACLRLLAKDPEQRPSLDWIDQHVLAPLGWERHRFASGPGPGQTPVYGRDTMLADLAAALPRRGSAFRVILLRGPSGIGKTQLIHWLTERATGDGMLVLRGRARAHERVPFNALDAVIDSLARALLDGAPVDSGRRRIRPSPAPRYPRARLTNVDAQSLSHEQRIEMLRAIAASAFPVFGPPVNGPEPGARSEAFSAVASLLAMAAGPDGAVVALDDLQWADRDSFALLGALVAAAPTRVLVVGTVRSEAEYASVVQRLSLLPGIERVDLPPLSASALAQIIARTAHQHGATAAMAVPDTLIEQCDGRALLAEMVGRAIAATPGVRNDRPLDAILDSLPSLANAIVAALFIADGALAVDLLASVVDQSPGDVDDHLRHLSAQGLVRVERVDRGTLADLYHDIVRTALEPRLDDEQRRAIHGAFVDRLPASTPPEQRARHLMGAGRTAEAVECARVAAQAAQARFAFGLAAEMYEIVLSAGQDAGSLRELATCLELTGRFARASGAWRELASITSAPTERAEIAMREATCLIGSADLRDGYRRLDEAMRAIGAPRLRSRGLGAARDLLRFALGPRRPRAIERTGPVDEKALQRAPLDRQLAVIASYFDPLIGIRFLLHTRDACDRAGAVVEAARCEYTLCLIAYVRACNRKPVPLAERYLAAASARLVGLADHDALHAAYQSGLRGVHCLRLGEFAEAVRLLEQSIATTEASGRGGRTEHFFLLMLRGLVALAQQKPADVAFHGHRLGASLSDVGATTMQAWPIQLGITSARWRGDDPRARELAAAAASRLSGTPLSQQEWVYAYLCLIPNIRLEDPRDVRRAFVQLIPHGKRLRMFSSMFSPIYLPPLALAEARAVLSGDRGASARATRRFAARAMQGPPLGSTGALRAVAYVQDHAGDRRGSIELLAEAEREAARWGQLIDVALARYQRGKRIAGAAGETLRSEAIELLAEVGAAGCWLDEDEV